MSGGVDSAVALLRAGPRAIGVTLRLWIDPEAPDAERACCSPEAVIAARETCHALGLPHVTLDLREEFRRAIVQPFVRAYARGETPNPCTRCNGSFRFARAARVRAPRGRGAAGDRPLRADRRAPRPAASWRAPSTRRRTSRTCSPGSTRVASSSSGSRWATRRRRRPAPRRSGRARGRTPRREPGGVLPRRRRLSRLPRAARPRRARGRDRRRGRTRARRPPRLLALHARASGAGSASRPAEPLYALAQRPGDEHRRRRPRASLARRPRSASGRLYASVTRGDAKLRYRSPAVAGRVEATARRVPPAAGRARVRCRRRPDRGSLRR